MAATSTLGITSGTDGRRFIDKRYRGIRIGMREYRDCWPMTGWNAVRPVSAVRNA
jgi:hypothetical protein